MAWEILGQGNFNRVSVDYDLSLVLKVQKQNLAESDLTLDIPERSVRLWNEINGDLEPKAKIVEIKVVDDNGDEKTVLAWTAPFVKGRNATMGEVFDSLIDIYNRTGRVVLDACVPSNFKTITLLDGKEKTICIDIGMSLRLQRDEPLNESFTSLDTWKETSKDSYLPWFKNLERNPKYERTTQLVEALFTLQTQFPYITNVDFLKKPENDELRTALAAALHDPKEFKMEKELNEAYEASKITHDSEYKP